MIEAYPLQWPFGIPRTRERKKSKFAGPTFVAAVKEIVAEVKRLKGVDTIVSSNVPLRADGLPYGDWQRRTITDPGVAVYFKRNGKPVVLVCDRWLRLEDNAHAIAKSIDAMRGLDRWGVTDILDRTFSGFLQLPAPEGYRPWWEVLGVPRSSSRQFAESYYKAGLKRAHPDMPGGSHAKMLELQRAWDELQRELQ